MKIEKFEDIISWQKGIELSSIVYDIFKSNRDYGFRDQIQRDFCILQKVQQER
ncbi:MAG: hypothetical protein US35_C0009G0011 [Parcubacteria group bacterium GW2011_GWA2_37_10]|nr:MAG: hypothetical protein US35_C0009G0011 [Parcubacteria group bacterium GW2011_GWA2_37_10]